MEIVNNRKKTNKYSTEKWIEKAIKTHGDRYDYSKVDYKNGKTKVIIICKTHGEFSQIAYSHTAGFNCVKCANPPKYSTIEWVDFANKTHNNKFNYSKVEYKKSNIHVTIICNDHGSFQQTPDDHIDRGCVKCNKDNAPQKLPLEKSFLYKNEEKSKFWSAKNKLKPEHVSASSGEKIIFDCNCGREFTMTLHCVQSGQWCPCCSGISLCDNNNCKYCYEKSFASSHRASQWSEDNECDPRDVSKFTHDEYIFNCDKCPHTFSKPLSAISGKNGWCPYCKNKELCDGNCKTCFKQSFASNIMAKYWSDKNGDITPRMCFKGSKNTYIFDCPYCEKDYKCTLDHINKGSWCPCSINKTETKLFKHLTDNYKFDITKGKSFPWCKNKKLLPFDIVIEDLKLIIELDGAQHFIQVSQWKSPIDTQTTDKYKMKCANNNNYSVIRILQEDVWYDRTDWQGDLKEFIKKYDKPTNCYIGDLYDGTFYNCS
jgi:very-short-patch-repair endonuclease